MFGGGWPRPSRRPGQLRRFLTGASRSTRARSCALSSASASSRRR